MKTKILSLCLCASFLTIKGQTPRLCLYELFTGETCPPTAATNPALNALLAQPANAAKMVTINWEVPIPSAPQATWSLYQTNKAEIEWRWRGTSLGGYGYPITQSPMGLIDGQYPMVFGGTNIHPAALNSTVIATAQSYTSAFSVTLNKAWDATYSSVNLTISILATANFTASGALVFRTVMIERNVDFSVAPGTTGEKHFEHVVIKSFPSIQSGVSMAGNWSIGQTQTFTLNCPLPSYVRDKSQIGIVGFIQDDGNRKVAQAVKSLPDSFAYDVKLLGIMANTLNCSSAAYSPTVLVKNTGTTSVNSLTVNVTFNGSAAQPGTWSGTLNPGDTLILALPNYTGSPLVTGSNTASYTVLVTGDYNTPNNVKGSTLFFPLPLIKVTANAKDYCVGELVVLSASGASSYEWNGDPTPSNTIAFTAITSKTIIVLGTDGLTGCRTQETVDVVVNECLGLSETTKQNTLIVSPNPFSNEFQIKRSLSQQAEHFSIFDPLGRIVSEGLIEKETALVQLGDLPPGIYTLKIGDQMIKIIKSD